MRYAFPRALVCALALLSLAALAPACARAEAGDRFDVSVFGSQNLERLHSIEADTLGLSFHTSFSSGANVDFRVIDLPLGKGPRKPALHVTGGVCTDTRILGPAIAGQKTAVYPVIDFSSGVALELPLDALVTGNTGVGIRVGWEGGYMLTRTGGQNFLERSKLRFDFVRTTGGLAGSTLGFGKGRDEVFGYDASSKRWDVKLSLQGRLIGMSAPAPPVAPRLAGKPAPAAAPAKGPTERLLWLFLDASLDTDGGPGADGLRARAGFGLDLNAFVTAAFTPLRN